MVITHGFAGIAVAHFAAAYDWYERLFGRPADMFPHSSEAVWRVSPSGSVYVVEDPSRAGKGLVTLALADLAAFEQQLRDCGLVFTVSAEGPAPRRLVCEDDDGNTVTFFQDPASPAA